MSVGGMKREYRIHDPLVWLPRLVSVCKENRQIRGIKAEKKVNKMKGKGWLERKTWKERSRVVRKEPK